MDFTPNNVGLIVQIKGGVNGGWEFVLGPRAKPAAIERGARCGFGPRMKFVATAVKPEGEHQIENHLY